MTDETAPNDAPEAAPFDGHQAFLVMLDRLERGALLLGAAAERARIAGIMDAPDAAGRLPFAWSLAGSGLPVNQALEALAVARVAAAFPPTDASAALSH